MTLLKNELEETEIELEQIEEMFENDNPEYSSEKEEDARECIARLKFCFEIEAHVKKSGMEFTFEDYSSVSESVYFYLCNRDGDCAKVRIASHISNYDKDIDIVCNSFARHAPSMKQVDKMINDFFNS